MARCPVCDYDVRTPSFLNLEGWSHLACPQCNARLEMKPPRSAAFGPIIAPLFVLARRGPVLEFLAFAYMFLIIAVLLIESMRPKLRVRKKLPPKPAVRLFD